MEKLFAEVKELEAENARLKRRVDKAFEILFRDVRPTDYCPSDFKLTNSTDCPGFENAIVKQCKSCFYQALASIE